MQCSMRFLFALRKETKIEIVQDKSWIEESVFYFPWFYSSYYTDTPFYNINTTFIILACNSCS